MWTPLHLSVLLLAVTRAAYISQEPSDVTAQVGDDVTLTCTVNSPDPTGNPFEWKKYLSSTTQESIYKNQPGGATSDQNKYEIDGTYDLVLRDLNLQDGSVFGCSLWKDEKPRTANLVVLDVPEVDQIGPVPHEGEISQVTCTARFGSPEFEEVSEAQLPMMEIYVNGEKQNGVVTRTEATSTDETSTITMFSNHTAKAENDQTNLTCRVYTESPSFEVIGYSNMDVMYSVRDIQVVSDRDDGVYYVGELLNCTALGNPFPEIWWESKMEGLDPVTVNDAQLELTGEMVGDNVWICIASNTVSETTTSEQEYTFTVQMSGASPLSAVTSSVLLSMAMVFLVTRMSH